MDFIKELEERAKKVYKTIVLCEGEDKRVIQAASIINRDKIAKIILLGNKEDIAKLEPKADLEGVTIIDPSTYEGTEDLGKLLFDLRAGKINKKTGEAEYPSVEDAKNYILKDKTMFGALLLKAKVADGFVSGACHTTANTLRPGLQVVKTKQGIKTVSSSFILSLPEALHNEYIPGGVCLFSDCAINIDPTAEELKDIALASAETARKIANIKEPKVAFLSFSTKGSGNDKKYTNSVEKVQEAVKLTREASPTLLVDGELQFDAAVAKEVAALKAPGSTVAGEANVFVFPNINAGNIGYKIAQRFGGWRAIGPICQGFSCPLNDLSRGCNVEDIVATVAVTALQVD